MAKHVLNSGGDEFDFGLIGISSADDQYRVVSLVNDALGTSLFLSDFVPMSLKQGEVFSFSLYRYVDENLGLEYFLVPNTSNFEPPGSPGTAAGLFAGQDVDKSTRLVRELPKTDFFMLIKGELHEHYKYTVIKSLRAVQAFTQVSSIEPQALQSRKNLIF